MQKYMSFSEMFPSSVPKIDAPYKDKEQKMDEEIKYKIDKAFSMDEAKKNLDKQLAANLRIISKHKELDLEHHDNPMHRIEALKLAYEFAINQIEGRIWHKLERKDQLEALRDMFELADLNLSYISNGKVEILD